MSGREGEREKGEREKGEREKGAQVRESERATPCISVVVPTSDCSCHILVCCV